MATSNTDPTITIRARRSRKRDAGAGAASGLAEEAGGRAPVIAAAARTFPPGGDFLLRLIPSSFR